MVVGQILEYAAQLWGMGYEEFEGLMTKDGDPLLTDIRAESWSEFHRSSLFRCKFSVCRRRLLRARLQFAKQVFLTALLRR